MVGTSSALKRYGALIFVNLFYACTGIFTKMASKQEFLSWSYVLWIAGAVGVMGVYALLWQQVLKHIELSTAYMFKGSGMIFGLLIAWALLGEQITLNNIIGAAIIIIGIALFAKAE
jgi:drug/metabolite transporter (DMT)-like permease